MPRITKIGLIGFSLVTVLVSFTVMVASSEEMSKAIKHSVVPEWPLEVLTKDVRESRMKRYIASNQFYLKSSDNKKSKEYCGTRLDALEKENYEILSPKHVFQKKFSSEGDMFSCSMKLINEVNITKEGKTEYEFRSTPNYNREYYDFSKALGDGVWGFFSEGGVLECSDKNQTLCDRLEGYRKYGYTAGTVFNAESCIVHLGPAFNVKSRITVNTDSPSRYKESPSFYAFIKIEREIYRLAFNVYSNFESADDSASINIEHVMNDERCIFQTGDLNWED